MEYISPEKVIELNLLALAVFKTKKADKHEVKSLEKVQLIHQ
jgi:hypothetical protein